MSASEVAHGSHGSGWGGGLATCSIAPVVKRYLVSELAKLQGLARSARRSSPRELRHFSKYSPG